MSIVWALFIAYLAFLVVLTVFAVRKAKRDPASFALGRKMNPVIAGMTIAASLASTATFVINPGFIFVHGVSAFLHLGVSAFAGMATGLLVVCGPFRRRGAAEGALTVPQWIGQRYGSTALRAYFAAINLLSLAFVVLIIGGLATIMYATLRLEYRTSVVVVTAIVVSYVLAGGAYANAYASTFQTTIKAVVAVMIVASGAAHLMDPAASLDRLAAIDPDLTHAINPASALFGTWFSVYASGFVIGFALMCQPHIMTTALYVDSDRGVRRALTVAIGLGCVFACVLLAGLFARLDGIDQAAIGGRQDKVMAVYLARTFSPEALALVTIAIIGSGMSAMASILVALSGIAGNDLYGLVRRARGLAPDTVASRRIGRIAVVGFAALAAFIALDPPKLLGIFGQLGTYGVVAGAAAPLVLGAIVPSLGKRAATAAALLGPTLHFTLYAIGRDAAVRAGAHAWGLDIGNPGVTAAVAILASAVTALGIHGLGLAFRTSSSVERPAYPARHLA
jgi:SSS family solute:Na+ symporter/sodium/pantothenate symporter